MLLVRARDARRHVRQAYHREFPGNNVHIFEIPNVAVTEVVLTGEPYQAPFVVSDELLQGILDKLEKEGPLPNSLKANLAVYNIPYFLQDEQFIVPMRARQPSYLLIGGSVFPMSVAELSMQVWHYVGMLLFHHLMHLGDSFVDDYRKLRGIPMDKHDTPIRNNRNRSMKRYETVTFLFGHDYRYFFGPVEAARQENFSPQIHDHQAEKDGSLARIKSAPTEEIRELIEAKCQNNDAT